MIDMTFHRKDLNTKALAFSGGEFLEASFHSRDVEYLPPVSWAEDEMIVDQ